MTANACSVSLRGVRRSYDGAPAVEDMNLEAPEGKVLALLGPSGSGKSTILRLIAGLEPVDGGEVRFGEEIVSARGRTLAPEARRVGFVFQDYSLFPHLTAAANVAFGLDRLSRAEREREASRWLDTVGLGRRAASYPHELSGGEQQRVALARALAPRPRAILLDEPFSGLDPVLRAELLEVTMGAIAEARPTAVFVTHVAEEALQVADRLAVLKAGRLLQEASPREAYDHPNSADVAAALGPVNLYNGSVRGGVLDTPFGSLAADLPDGSPAQAVVRLEALSLRPGAAARVRDRRPHGASDLLRIEAGGHIWRAFAPPRTALSQSVDVTFDPAGVFVFPL
ncbi:MAG TPA: ABC transporter ATP-binding protein [Caulobacterales bacterium]|nr:ABC transporter ATP-binding protein [Caulobacterales bacterium]